MRNERVTGYSRPGDSTREKGAPCRTRTYNPLIKSQTRGGSQTQAPQDSTTDSAPVTTPRLTKPAENDPDLARLVAAWPELPEVIRRAMVALVESARPRP